MPIRLVLADDHPIVLQGLRELFLLEPDMTVVACAHNGDAALQAVRKFQPDILVLDLRMPVKDGIAVVREMKRDALPTKVVVLTGIESGEVFEAIELGVRGIVLKDMAPELLMRAVREVHAGGTWIERGAATHAVGRLVQRNASLRRSVANLTPREVEVARLIAKGLSNKTVAETLKITEGTAKLHLHHVYEKLQLDGRMALARYLQSRGIG